MKGSNRLGALLLLMLWAPVGCESLQKKFTRERKGPQERPQPVIRFKDYSRGEDPEAAYQQAYMTYSYAARDLVFELEQGGRNSRRARLLAQQGFDALQSLMAKLVAPRDAEFAPLLESWADMTRRLKAKTVPPGEIPMLAHSVDAHQRAMHRDFRLLQVKDALQSPQQEPANEFEQGQDSQPASEASPEAPPEDAAP